MVPLSQQEQVLRQAPCRIGVSSTIGDIWQESTQQSREDLNEDHPCKRERVSDRRTNRGELTCGTRQAIGR
eukprot:8199515-Heterocapsa_arctica.AAC.1